MKTIYHNGAVYTGELPLSEAFVVCGDRFTFVGRSRDALALREDGDTVIDLESRFVCAGFNDSHMHLLNYGQVLENARLDQHTDSLSGMVAYLKDFADSHPERGWIVGRGWNQDFYTDEHRMPDRHDLDRVSTDRPVCAVRCCGHALAVNSKALELLRITADTPQPDGGEIVLAHGQPNGLFFDSAMDLVYQAIPAPTKEEVKDMLRAACRALNGYGVTSCHSDDYSIFAALPWQTVNEAYRELEEAGELTVRVYEQCNFTNLPAFREFVETGRVKGTWFRTGSLKMLGDGALGPRTAYLSRPYADAPDTCGIPVFSQETFDEMIGYAHEQGIHAAIHAIGDACLDRVLSVMEKALTAHPRDDHRHGIVHCQITRPDQLEKIAELGLHIYAQSIFLDYDTHILHARVGEELAKSSYCWKTLLQKGVTVSNGTDCPVELPFAMGGIQCAVTRSDLRGSVPPHLPEEGFTVQEALDSYTAAGAYASFEEDSKGKIKAGMLADFVVLGENPFTAPELCKIPVLATYAGGVKVYEA